MARSNGPAGISVSRKLFSVLECFDERGSLRLTEISRGAGLPLSTTRRLVMELTEWGGLERLSDGSYQVGMRLWQIGAGAPERRNLREAALPFMQDLYAASRENVQLVVLDDLSALCIEKIYGRKAIPTEIDVGERLALHATAAGKALLAFSGPELLRDALDAGLERCTPHTLIEPGRLNSALRSIRKTGIAYSQEERTFGIVSAASPVQTPDGGVSGAISVVARVGTPMTRLGPAVRTAALSISRAIAPPPKPGCRRVS